MQAEPNELIKYALFEAVRRINQEKLSPQAALEKVAVEYDLNPNFIKRVSEGLNVALHYDHFKKHAEAKDADFPITDAAVVVGKIFGEKEKTAAENSAEWFSITETQPVDLDFNKILANPLYKQAYLQISSADASDSFEMSAKGVFEKSAHYIENLEKKATELRIQKVGTELETNRLFSRIVGEFSKDAAYRPTFGEFESQVYSNHGEQAVPYLDLIHKTAGVDEPRGVHDSAYKMFDSSSVVKTFGEFFKKSQELVDLYNAQTEADESLEFERGYLKEAFMKRGNFGGEVEEQVPLKKSLLCFDDDPVAKQAEDQKPPKKQEGQFGVFDPLVQTFQQAGAPSAPKESKLDTLERKLMLQDLMVRDPIISKAAPEQVAGFYEQFLKVAPELAKEKEITRSVLRLAGSAQAVTPFDAQQWIEANTDLIKQRMLQRGEVPPKI